MPAGVLPRTGPVLVAARAVQGLGSALTAPTALALTATMFPAGQARNRALALYGVMSGLGVTAGLLLGGVLTGMLGWRWGFFIDIPIGLALLAGTRILVDPPRHTGRLDPPGAMTGTGGIAALVFAAILWLSTISVTTTDSRFPKAPAGLREARAVDDTDAVATAGRAIVDGYTTALSSGAIILAVAALIVALLVAARPRQAAGNRLARTLGLGS